MLNDKKNKITCSFDNFDYAIYLFFQNEYIYTFILGFDYASVF